MRDIDRYLAATPAHCAEHHLAQQLRDQIAAENLQINLTQRYATHDLAQAQQRHSEAVKNLTPLIENAREFGFTVRAGNALTEQQAHKEILSESQGMSV